MNKKLQISQSDEYLPIGRFALASQLSRKALRIYDQLGILTPDHIDQLNGYRYYHIRQIKKARFIRMLRSMEMPLAEIRQVINAPTQEEAIQIVKTCNQEFENKVEYVRKASLKVITYLQKEIEPMSIPIEIKSFPSYQTISIKKNITVPAFHQFIPQALEKLFSCAQQNQLSILGDPICLYYGPVNKSDDGPVEICLPIRGEISPKGEISQNVIKAHQAAIGKAKPEQSNFPAILEVWDAVMGWVYDNQYLANEEVTCYEIWHEDRSITVAQPVRN